MKLLTTLFALATITLFGQAMLYSQTCTGTAGWFISAQKDDYRGTNV